MSLIDQSIDISTKVYGIVSLQLLSTILVCLITMSSNWITMFMINYYTEIMVCSFIGSMITLFGCFINEYNYPENIYWLSSFTLFISFEMSSACAIVSKSGYAILILQSLILTAIITFILIKYSLSTQRVFTHWNTTLNWVILGLIGTSLFGIFIYPIPYQELMVGIIGSITFSIYLIVDVQLISTKLTNDQYITGAIMIYLDIINIFIHILTILVKLSNDKDKKKKK